MFKGNELRIDFPENGKNEAMKELREKIEKAQENLSKFINYRLTKQYELKLNTLLIFSNVAVTIEFIIYGEHVAYIEISILGSEGFIEENGGCDMITYRYNDTLGNTDTLRRIFNSIQEHVNQ